MVFVVASTSGRCVGAAALLRDFAFCRYGFTFCKVCYVVIRLANVCG